VRLKSFTAPTMAAAMEQVRVALGEDAIIVATREDPDGVRLTAAIDETAPGAPPEPAPRFPEDRPADVVDAAYRVFKANGLPAVIGETLMERVGQVDSRDPATAIATALRQTFRFDPLGDRAFDRPVMLVGPPGAGKTQTVAKLAARGLLAQRRVMVATTDTERTGGIAPLAAFMDGLRLGVTRAETAAELAAALIADGGADQVIVDSAGRNHLDEDDMAGLADFLIDSRVEPVLVLPAGIDGVEAGDIARTFADLGVTRFIATRLDMTRRLGGVLAAAWAAGLSLAEFGRTPRLKRGLEPADPRLLARLMMPEPAAAPLRKTGTDR
jgi:flagellar biosynthesis protein FlhF